MTKDKDKKVIKYDFEKSREEDDGLTLASKGWVTGDDAVDLMGDIRSDVEED